MRGSAFSGGSACSGYGDVPAGLGGDPAGTRATVLSRAVAFLAVFASRG